MKYFRHPQPIHKITHRALSLVALTGFLTFLTAPLTTLAAQNLPTRTDGNTTVTTQETYAALKQTAGVLDTSAQTKTTSDTDTALQAASAGATISIPKDAAKGASLEGLSISVSLPNAKKGQDHCQRYCRI